MAKEEVHHWLRTTVLLAGIIFAGGGYAMKIRSNSTDIDKAEVKIDKTIEEGRSERKEITEDVQRIELNQGEIKAVAVRAAEAMISVDNKLTSIQKTQSAQATIQAVNSEKLKTLTKE